MLATGRWIITWTFVLLGAMLQAQSIAQWIAWGDAAMAREEYYGASRFYGGALSLEPGRMSLQWKQAEACRLSNQYDKAAELYEKVQRKDMGRTYRDCLRWLAEMQMCQGLYVEAERTWNKVLLKEKDKGSFAAQRAINAIAGCKMGREAADTPSQVAIEHLPQPVNTYDSEFGARIGPDSLLYFTSLRGELNDDDEVKDTANYFANVFTAQRHHASWAEPQKLSPVVNTTGNNANAAWTSDGRWFLFTRCVAGSPCRIWIAPTHAQGDAHPLPGIGDTTVSTQPTVVRWDNREMLLFVTDREGGQGGMDIWQAELHDGEAKYLNPLGRPVNTPGNERSPWYDPVTNALWYSSDFLPGLGGYDIFSAAFGNDVFANPVNAGRPLNSPANDLYPSYDPVHNEGWLTSNRVGSLAAKGETCCNDLYRFHFDHPPIVVVDTTRAHEPVIRSSTSVERLVTLQQRFPLKLYFHNDDPDPRSWNTTTPQTYEETYVRFKSLMPEYEREQNEPQALHAFFRDDVDRGHAELGQLVSALIPLLEEGGTATLEVRGHASPLARNDYNRNLSQRRIESLRNHLRAVENGRLLSYLNGTSTNGAALSIRELPFGEDRSASGVSDDLGDLKRSVYSVDAARERRIEIEAMQLLRSERSAMTERQVATLGSLIQNQQRDVVFHLKNNGTSPMRLLKSEADCGCTTADLPDRLIAPGEQVEVTVHFNGRAPDGPLRRAVHVSTDGEPARFELVIEGTMVP